MKQEDYLETWNRLMTESMELESRQATLETELNEIKNELQHLEEVLNHLRPLAGMAWGDDIRGLGITDAIRMVLQNSKERMSAPEIRRALANKGFDFSGISAEMASVYKVLSRLEGSGEAVRESEGRQVYYKWKRPEDSAPPPDDFAQSAEISDDDIPF